jgi:hypothetical protein
VSIAVTELAEEGDEDNAVLYRDAEKHDESNLSRHRNLHPEGDDGNLEIGELCKRYALTAWCRAQQSIGLHRRLRFRPR